MSVVVGLRYESVVSVVVGLRCEPVASVEELRFESPASSCGDVGGGEKGHAG